MDVVSAIGALCQVTPCKKILYTGSVLERSAYRWEVVVMGSFSASVVVMGSFSAFVVCGVMQTS